MQKCSSFWKYGALFCPAICLKSLEVTDSKTWASITSRDYAYVHSEANTVARHETGLMTSFVRCEEDETVNEHRDDVDGETGIWSPASSFASSEKRKTLKHLETSLLPWQQLILLYSWWMECICTALTGLREMVTGCCEYQESSELFTTELLKMARESRNV